MVPCLTLSFLLLLTYNVIWAHRYLCFHAQLGARIRAKLSSLSSTSAKMLTSLAINPLLYLL
jgi:hypothetical protein